MITLDPSSADFARYELSEQAKRLRKDVKRLRERGAGHLPIRRAAEYVADAYARAAAELEKAHAAINPPPAQHSV